MQNCASRWIMGTGGNELFLNKSNVVFEGCELNALFEIGKCLICGNAYVTDICMNKLHSEDQLFICCFFCLNTIWGGGGES